LAVGVEEGEGEGEGEGEEKEKEKRQGKEKGKKAKIEQKSASDASTAIVSPSASGRNSHVYGSVLGSATHSSGLHSGDYVTNLLGLRLLSLRQYADPAFFAYPSFSHSLPSTLHSKSVDLFDKEGGGLRPTCRATMIRSQRRI